LKSNTWRIDPEHLGFVWREPSTQRLGEYVERLGVSLRQGQIVEINLDAIDWLARMTKALRHGFLVTVDYGDTAEVLWTSDRKFGTLRSFYRHRLVDSPLDRIGEQDITASVNFSALIEYGRDFGLELLGYERQTAFLTRLGLIERIAAQHKPSDSLEDLKERLAVKNLFVPGGVSDSFRVLIQRRA
jgi:SAM-dependent MidA family methyltransferase